MFACTAYPADSTFLKRVSEEADYNIKRLRNHACLAMWCGNNEVFEGMKYWGWKSRYSPEVYAKMRSDYDKLFRELLPAKVQQWDEGRSYVHTSPYFANWGVRSLGGQATATIGEYGTEKSLLNLPIRKSAGSRANSV